MSRIICVIIFLLPFFVNAQEECITEQKLIKAIEGRDLSIEFAVKQKLNYQNSIDTIRSLLLYRFKSKEGSDSELVMSMDRDIDTEFGNLHIALLSTDKLVEVTEKVNSLIRFTEASFRIKETVIEISNLEKVSVIVGYNES